VIQDGCWKMSRSHFTKRWPITRPLLADSVIAEGIFAEDGQVEQSRLLP